MMYMYVKIALVSHFFILFVIKVRGRVANQKGAGHALIKSASAAVSLPPNEKANSIFNSRIYAKMSRISIFLQ